MHPLFVVGDMAADHIAGLAFGGQQPHSPSEHVVDPNVLVIHSVKVSPPYIPIDFLQEQKITYRYVNVCLVNSASLLVIGAVYTQCTL